MLSNRSPGAAFARRYRAGRFIFVLSIFIFGVSVAGGAAWSLEDAATQKTAFNVAAIGPQAGADFETNTKALSMRRAGGCSPALETARSSPGQRGMDEYRRSAGAVAALGLALGMRYALTPPQGLTSVKTRGGKLCS